MFVKIGHHFLFIRIKEYMKLKRLLLTTLLASSICATAQAEDLLDIYKEAYIKDPLVLQAKAQRDSAVAKIDEATAALLPQINVVGAISRTVTNVNELNNTSRSNNQATGGVNLSQALWRHSAWKNRSITQKQAAAQDLSYNDSLQSLIIRVCNAYFGVLSAKDTLKFQKANSDALKQQLREATRRFQVGLIAETDQLEAKATYDLSIAQVITAENNLINSYEELRKLLGRDVRNLAELNEKTFSPQSMTKTLDQILTKAKENNLSLQASIINRDIAKDQITLAQTGFEPTLDIVGSYNTTYVDFDTQIPNNQVSANSHEGTIGLNFNLPLFSGGATMSQVSQAEQNYIVASENLEYTYRTVVANVNSGYNNVNAAISSVRAYEQLAKSAKSALEATQAGYDVGTRTITDVLNATQSLYNAMQNLSTARYQYILSRLNLLYTQGTLTVADLEAVNKGLK